jgi:hypothetical protein
MISLPLTAEAINQLSAVDERSAVRTRMFKINLERDFLTTAFIQWNGKIPIVLYV